jgi:hypothetical protein
MPVPPQLDIDFSQADDIVPFQARRLVMKTHGPATALALLVVTLAGCDSLSNLSEPDRVSIYAQLQAAGKSGDAPPTTAFPRTDDGYQPKREEPDPNMSKLGTPSPR